jgi:hypothetical protein
MQVGETIKGHKTGKAYTLTKPLGTPGLFGQAFLCEDRDDQTSTVVKTMRTGRPADDRERFFEEARTLQRVAKVEEQAGVHYAVRLLDTSHPNAPEPFLILERATGQNVLLDILETVPNWDYAPLDEHLALDIALHFARALSYTHQAGLCYDDMKLDNLFWEPRRPDGCPLRIIDWNVTSESSERGGVAGDWARFGARLYEMRTGIRIGIDRDGSVMGEGPRGPRWQRLPAGIRAIIEKALSLAYQDDAVLLRDMEREQVQAKMTWADLLERATSADGAGKDIEVLAPLSRAKPLIEQLAREDPQRERALERCAELRERAETRRGVASASKLTTARGLIGREPRFAAERLERLYAEASKLDPRPRRWLWLAEVAQQNSAVYKAYRADLEAAIVALDRDDPATARTNFAVVEAPPDLAPLTSLRAETEALFQAKNGNLDGALENLEKLQHLFGTYPDLRERKEDLEREQQTRAAREEAERRTQELWEDAKEFDKRSKQQVEQEKWEEAVTELEKALRSVDTLLREGCTPDLEKAAREAKKRNEARLDVVRRRNALEGILEEASRYHTEIERSRKERAARKADEALALIEELKGQINLPHDIANEMRAISHEAKKAKTNISDPRKIALGVQLLLDSRVGELLDQGRTTEASALVKANPLVPALGTTEDEPSGQDETGGLTPPALGTTPPGVLRLIHTLLDQGKTTEAEALIEANKQNRTGSGGLSRISQNDDFPRATEENLQRLLRERASELLKQGKTTAAAVLLEEART